MKRILIYTTAYYPMVGGAEVAIKEITDRLNNYEFDLITARLDKNLPKQEKIGKVNVYRLGWGKPKIDKLYLAWQGHLLGLKLHSQKPYQAVWAIMASFGGFAALSFKLKTKIPFLLTLQEGDPFKEILAKVRLVRTRFNKIFELADGLQAISLYLLDWGRQMGFAGKVSEVIPNGVDVKKFTREFNQEEIKNTRKLFGFKGNSIILITASRLVIKNGIVDVIKALKLLPDNICFYIIGGGFLEKELKILTGRLRLSERVKFGGYRSHDELPKLLAAGDIFIRPSLSEGLGNAFLEAMAVGLPTIGTPVGGIPDFLINGQTGLICEPENIRSIAETILRAVNLSQAEKNSFKAMALWLIEKKYNWEYISGRMDQIFIDLITSL